MQTTLTPEAQAVSNGETEDLNTLDPVPQEDPGFASIPLGFERDGDEAPVIAAQGGPQAALDDFPFTAEGDGIEEEPTDKGLPVQFLTAFTDDQAALSVEDAQIGTMDPWEEDFAF